VNGGQSSQLGFNLNSVLLSGLFALCGWTLYTVSGQNAVAASQQVRLENHEKNIADIQIRVTGMEADLVLLKIQLAKEIAKYERESRESR
jgi:hypothetical protein